MPRGHFTKDNWIIEPPAVVALFNKIKESGIPLAEQVGSAPMYGVKTGFNQAFLIDTPTRDRLVAEHGSADEIIKPYLRGQDVARWHGANNGNPCEGIKQLYSNDRPEIIWQPSDIDQLKKSCATEIAHAANLDAHTGLRLSDLIRLSWSHVGEHAITITTGKSNHRRTAIIPIYDELRAILDAIPRRSPVILTNSDGGPWTPNSFGSAFNRAKIAAKLDDRDLHFHDLRGTAVTKFYVAGIPERAIAEIMAWEEETVSRITRRYVDRAAATKNLIAIMNRKKNEG